MYKHHSLSKEIIAEMSFSLLCLQMRHKVIFFGKAQHVVVSDIHHICLYWLFGQQL